MDNKDIIKSGMQAMIDISKFLVSSLSSIISILGGGSTSYSDAVTNNTTKIVNNNISVDQTYNSTGQTQNDLLNFGTATYEQIVSMIAQ